MHYRRHRREVYGVCSVEGCDRLASRLNDKLCPMHTRRVRLTGNVGPAGPARKNADGTFRAARRERYIKYASPSRPGRGAYVMVSVPEHPKANAKGYVLEHRYVMEQRLGRLLLDHENVHHINGDTTDNRLENLELWSTMQPSGQRPEDKVAFAEEIIALYRHLVK